MNGNLTKKTNKANNSRQEYSWNAENQMQQARVYKDASTLQITINYKYDPSGRRIERAVTNHLTPAKSYVHKYVYDKQHIVAILSGSDEVLAAFIFDEGIDEPVAMVTDYNGDGELDVLSFLRDRQNSVKVITNEKKEIIQEIQYSAYGETQIVNRGQGNKAKLINPFYYTSRELEPELGIYYYRARYYDPSVGRFLSEDPIGFAGGDTNFYRYVSNMPVIATDPSGKNMLLRALIGALAAAVAIAEKAGLLDRMVKNLEDDINESDKKENENTNKPEKPSEPPPEKPGSCSPGVT